MMEPTVRFLKATQIVDSICDQTGTSAPSSDSTRKNAGKFYSQKRFLYSYGGFQCAEQTFNIGRDANEEGVKVFDRTTRNWSLIEELKARHSAVKKQKEWRHGLRACECCRETEVSSDTFLKCPKCKQVFYCSVDCQTDDWKGHRIWCCKTYEQVVEARAKRYPKAYGRVRNIESGLPKQAETGAGAASAEPVVAITTGERAEMIGVARESKKRAEAVDKSKCSECDKESRALQMCSICEEAFYCSKECQAKAWKGGHKAVCNIIRETKKAKKRAAEKVG